MQNTNTNQQLSNPSPNPTSLSWSAPDRMVYERGRKWYIATGTVAALCLLYSLLTGAWSFTIVLILICAVYAYVYKETPSERTIAIGDDSFTFDAEEIPWHECTGFWFQHFPTHTELHIERNAGFRREYVIFTESQDLATLRDTLQLLLPEHTHRRERILDTLFRVCKL